jgi:hypothetical protein
MESRIAQRADGLNFFHQSGNTTQESFGFRKRIVLNPNYIKAIKTRSVRHEGNIGEATTDWVVYYHPMGNHSDQDVVDEDDE